MSMIKKKYIHVPFSVVAVAVVVVLCFFFYNCGKIWSCDRDVVSKAIKIAKLRSQLWLQT